jgi:hypothetical protein
VVLVRPLGLTHVDAEKRVDGGVQGVCTPGFAVHDDNITTRGHPVSFNKTPGLGTKADIQAVKLL